MNLALEWADDLNAVLLEQGLKIVEPSVSDKAALELESQGWEAWLRHLFPHLFSRPFASYQQGFWEWGWAIEPKKYYRPRVECEPRGVGKSTNAEALVVNLVARKRRKMIGYVSLNEQKATKHFESIKSMLESNKLLELYPHCHPKTQKLKDTAAQWSREAIVTDSGAMIVPLTLLGSSRGWKSSDGTRFDVIVLDDIDELGQSPDFTKKLIEMLKGEILAAGNDETVVIMPQNLIYRDSICSQIKDQRADILSDRIFCGPFPLLSRYEAEKRDLEGDNTGAKEWIITSGAAFDPAISIEYAQKLLNKFGKETFDRECQQEVMKIEDDKDFREWSEIYHLITYSEFRRVMEMYAEDVWDKNRKHLKIPHRWNVGTGLDWGTTVGHPSVVTYVARPSEHFPLKDSHFVIGEIVRPKFPKDSFEDAELVSPGRIAECMKQFQREWGIQDSQIKMQLMSHEASAALNTMRVDLQEDIQQFFSKWKAKKGSGVPQIQNLLEIDYDKPHPFRVYPEGYKKNGHDLSGLPIMGCPRLFFLVEDGQGELQVDMNGGLYVIGAKNEKGFSRARFEMPLYSFRNQGQSKIDDDFVDSFRGLMNMFSVSQEIKTEEERLEEAMPQAYRMSTLRAESPYKHGLTDGQELARALMQSEIAEKLKYEHKKPYWMGEDEDDDDRWEIGTGY